MRILFVAPRFHTNQYQVVKTLLEHAHEVFFHVASIGFTEDHSLVQPVRYRQSRLSLLLEKMLGKGGVNRPHYFPNALAYWRAFRQLRPQLVVIREPYRPFSLLVALCARLVRSKIVFYTQEELARKTSRTAAVKRHLFLRFFHAAWMTPMPGASAAAQSNQKYMYHVPIPIPIPTVAPLQKPVGPEGPRILMVGKYHQARKNHLLFLKAVRELHAAHRFQVTIVGECMRDTQIAKYHDLKKVVADFGLSGVVEMKANVPFSQMRDLYGSHHFFVLPARDEQYGVSVTEALGYGLPAICTDTCGARYNIVNGVNGFVVRSDSLQELTAAMRTLIASQETAASMSAHSLQYVHRHLSGAAFYAKFSQMLNDRFQLQCQQTAQAEAG